MIRRVHQDERNMIVTLPSLRVRRSRNCWICNKFSQWLKINDPKHFKIWHRRSLRVKITRYAQMFHEEPQQNTLLPLWVDIRPSGYGEDSDSCFVELHFISATGNTPLSGSIAFR